MTFTITKHKEMNQTHRRKRDQIVLFTIQVTSFKLENESFGKLKFGTKKNYVLRHSEEIFETARYNMVQK